MKKIWFFDLQVKLQWLPETLQNFHHMYKHMYGLQKKFFLKRTQVFWIPKIKLLELDSIFCKFWHQKYFKVEIHCNHMGVCHTRHSNKNKLVTITACPNSFHTLFDLMKNWNTSHIVCTLMYRVRWSSCVTCFYRWALESNYCCSTSLFDSAYLRSKTDDSNSVVIFENLTKQFWRCSDKTTKVFPKISRKSQTTTNMLLN